MPKTKLGKWSIRLIVGFFLSYLLFRLAVALGYRGGDTFFSNPLLALFAISMIISGTCSFFTGITSIIKYKERSILVILATLFGLFVLYFFLGEILSPH